MRYKPANPESIRTNFVDGTAVGYSGNDFVMEVLQWRVMSSARQFEVTSDNYTSGTSTADNVPVYQSGMTYHRIAVRGWVLSDKSMNLSNLGKAGTGLTLRFDNGHTLTLTVVRMFNVEFGVSRKNQQDVPAMLHGVFATLTENVS